MSAVDEIYEAVIDDTAYARVPAVLAAATGARSSIMIDLDEAMQSQSWVQHQVSDAVLSRYAALEMWRHDIWSHRMARPGYRNRAVQSDEVVDVAGFRDTIFYNELYRPLGDDTARCLGVVLDRPGGSLAIGLHRAFGQPAYDDGDRERLQSLVPHLRRLVAARARLQQADRRADLLGAALDQTPCSLLVLDRAGHLLLANRRGEDLVRMGLGLKSERGRVVPADPRMAARFAEAIRSAASGTGLRGDAMRLYAAAGTILTVLVTPLNGPTPGALVLIDDHRRQRPLDQTLMTMFGLTPAEAAIADLLAQGLSPAEAATTRGVGLSTVRSQIQVLLQKTHSGSLHDLQRTLGRIEGLLGEARKP